MTRPKKTNGFVNKARRHFSEWWEDFADSALGSPIPVVKPVVKLYRYFRDAPKVLTRQELYEDGLEMLKSARKSIVAVNTVAREDSPNFLLMPNHRNEKDYYEQLFRRVQKNRYKVGEPLSVRRYMDLGDVNKCEEAISLLMYGGDIEIFDSMIQIEFLVRDDEDVLLGFAEGRELSYGIKLTNKGLAQALNTWIKSQVKHLKGPEGGAQGGALAGQAEETRVVASFVNTRKLVNHIKERREELKKTIEPKSLIHAVELLDSMGVEDPFEATKRAFDDFKDWYPNLYDETKSRGCYVALAKSVIHELFENEHPTFLDCGCAHGLGAGVLSRQGIEYWGVDASPELIEIAKGRWGIRNFIAGDIVKVLLDKKTRTDESRRLPEKFDVIACQGNTFDFFLGEPQKWFMLTLFRSRLKKGGILFFTQMSFAEGKDKVERAIPLVPGKSNTILYNLTRKGDFIRLDVEVEGQCIGSVIRHLTTLPWLEETCRGLGFMRLTEKENSLPEWFKPRGAEHPQDVYIFRLQND